MLTEQDIVRWHQEKAEARMRDKQAVLAGKLRPEDLSWFHFIGAEIGPIDFSKIEAALEQGDDSTWTDD